MTEWVVLRWASLARLAKSLCFERHLNSRAKMPGHTYTEVSHAIHSDALWARVWVVRTDPGAAGTGHGGLQRLHRGTQERRSPEGREPPPVDFDCNDCACREWQVAGAGWPVCGLERAAWRVLHHRCARSRCRDLVGSAVPGCKSRSRRGASALGQGGVRCP